MFKCLKNPTKKKLIDKIPIVLDFFGDCLSKRILFKIKSEKESIYELETKARKKIRSILKKEENLPDLLWLHYTPMRNDREKGYEAEVIGIYNPDSFSPYLSTTIH